MNFHFRYQGFPRKYPWLFILAFLTSWNFYPWKYKISAVHPRNFLGIFWYLYLRDFLRIFPPGNPGRGWDSFMKKDMRTKICLLSGDGYFVILENGNCTKKAIGYKKIYQLQNDTSIISGFEIGKGTQIISNSVSNEKVQTS